MVSKPERATIEGQTASQGTDAVTGVPPGLRQKGEDMRANKPQAEHLPAGFHMCHTTQMLCHPPPCYDMEPSRMCLHVTMETDGLEARAWLDPQSGRDEALPPQFPQCAQLWEVEGSRAVGSGTLGIYGLPLGESWPYVFLNLCFSTSSRHSPCACERQSRKGLGMQTQARGSRGEGARWGIVFFH
jgi:hypothetical protein